MYGIELNGKTKMPLCKHMSQSLMAIISTWCSDQQVSDTPMHDSEFKDIVQAPYAIQVPTLLKFPV